jgi:FkbM family methyltransferase
MQIEPFHWRPSATYLAHLWKAATQQHHTELLPTLRRLIPRDAIIFDVGAHAGQFTKLFASLAPDGRIWSFEPGSYARSILHMALWLNRVHNVSVVPMGLAHLGFAEARWSRVAVEPVALTTIDGFAAAQGIDRLDFIKADVEGWEAAMLRGGIETLLRLKPRLLLELDANYLARAGDTLAGAFELLARLGYRPYSLHASGGLIPIAEPACGDVWWLPPGDRLA